jgi:peptide deformylase
MRTKMQAAGIGLAANQVNHNLQLFMIEFLEDSPASKRYANRFKAIPFQVFINPKITAHSTETVSFWHGCLSALDSPRGKVATWAWIEYEAFNEHGEFKKGRLTDLAAVIFQHEFRHLLGSCYVEYAIEFKDRDTLSKEFAAGLDPLQPCGPEVPHLLANFSLDA